jgi:hypothetical protein
MPSTEVAFLVHVDGQIEPVEPETPRSWTLVELQKLVGGFVEPVKDPAGVREKGWWAFFDEEGCLKGLPRNPEASRIVGIDLVGPVLITPHKWVK